MTRLFKWLGGVAFVASLAYWVLWYLILIDRPATGAAASAAVVDITLFTLFASHHSILARTAIQRRLSFIPSTLMRSVYIWTASLLLIGVCAMWQPVGGGVYRIAGGAIAALAAVQLIGVWLIARSAAAIDPLELAGIRPPRTGDAGLQTSGPYRLVRHPLYLGWMLFVFAAPNMTTDRLLFASISSLYLLIAAPWEERSLRQSFGGAYADYQERVRWRVIPFVY